MSDPVVESLAQAIGAELVRGDRGEVLLTADLDGQEVWIGAPPGFLRVHVRRDLSARPHGFSVAVSLVEQDSRSEGDGLPWVQVWPERLEISAAGSVRGVLERMFPPRIGARLYEVLWHDMLLQIDRDGVRFGLRAPARASEVAGVVDRLRFFVAIAVRIDAP